MRKRNWREYNKRLVQRGSLTFLIDPKVMKTLAPKAQKKKKGRPLEFSDQLILTLLMIKIHYKMPYRMLEGFARFFFEQFKKVKIPTYSLTCKRASGADFCVWSERPLPNGKARLKTKKMLPSRRRRFSQSRFKSL